MAERTLSQRELNRAVLARQLLLERVRLPIPRVLERIGGIQDQYAPSAYIRLWSCLEGFRRDDLTRVLERRSVVQATLMRSTIHVVSRRDYRSQIFPTTMPQSVGTFLVDGVVAGTWRYTDGRVRSEPFARLDRAAGREVAEEGERLAAFHA